MPTERPIRWTKNQVKELYRDVRVYNASRTKAIKKNPELAKYLPPKLNIDWTKGAIATRDDLKELTREVDRELKYKFETVTLPGGDVKLKSEVEKVRTLAEMANREKEKVRKQRGIRKKPVGEMGSVSETDLGVPFRTDIENIHSKDWDKFVKTVELRSTPSYYRWEENQFKENYIEAIWRAYGATEETLVLVELIEKIPASKMLRAVKADARLTIQEIYPDVLDTGDQIQERFNDVMNRWNDWTCEQ